MADGLKSWQLKNTASNAQQRVTRSVSCYPNLTMRRWSLYHQRITRMTDPIGHHVAGTERQLEPNTSPHHFAVKAEKQQLGDTHMTYDRT